MKRYNTIYHKLIGLVLAVVVPLIALLAGNFIYSIYQVRNKVIESNQSAVTFYSQQLDTALNNTTKYLLTLSTTNENMANINNSNPNTRFLASFSLITELRNQLSLYNVDYFFLYTTSYQNYNHIYNPSTINIRASKAIRSYMNQAINAQNFSYQWKLVTIDGCDYLCFAYWNKDYYLGTLIKTDTLRASLAGFENGEQAAFYITDQDGNSSQYEDYLQTQEITLHKTNKNYYFTGVKKQFIAISQDSDTDSYILWELIPDRNVLGLLDLNQIFIFLLTILMLFFLPITIFLIYHWILQPLGKLLSGIRELEHGNLNYRINEKKTSDEFTEVNQSFNSMASQITHLRIQIYEETIEKQRAELNFLQMQIKPHFFLNALTTVSNYARLSQMDNLHQFLSYLSVHTRYMFQKNISTVPICEEILHVENYLAMQNLQHKDSIISFSTIEEELENFPIPSFALFTFAENSVKHALTLDRPLTVLINAKTSIIDNQKKIQIILEDDGKGFTEEYLQHFIKSTFVDSADPRHLGIRNVKKTIQLIYGEEGSLSLSISELGGAKITMLLPLPDALCSTQQEASI